jgi:hypothetical protein
MMMTYDIHQATHTTTMGVWTKLLGWCWWSYHQHWWYSHHLSTVSLAGTSGTKISTYFTGRIAADEEVLLFPTIATAFNDTHWQVPLHGWIFEPERDDRKRQALLSVLRRALQLQRDETESTTFIRRAQWFLVDNERWKSPQIEILGRTYRVPLSAKNGHFQGVACIQLDNHTADTTGPRCIQTTTNSSGTVMDTTRLLPLEARAIDGRVFTTQAHLVPPTHGWSVISDIDDTIKISNVTHKRTLLRNTFLKEFQPVPGMPELYQRWKERYNASFHFVSSSPYQLYTDLEAFRQRCGFPPATFHLKILRPKDKSLILKLLANPFKTKNATIAAILDRLPNRRFILVGDSGEKDPEVYGNLARLYPDQIHAIFIRKIILQHGRHSMRRNDEFSFNERMESAFKNVSSCKWSWFENPDEIDNVLNQST